MLISTVRAATIYHVGEIITFGQAFQNLERIRPFNNVKFQPLWQNANIVGDCHNETTMDLFLCSECGELSTQSLECRGCGEAIPVANQIQPGRPVGLIGLPCTGKTCYLAAAHDQMMHAAPEWRVEVDDRAFEKLSDDYWRMCEGGIPDKTMEVGCSAGFFKLTVHYRDQPFELVMNDMAGEFTWRFAEDEHSLENADASDDV